MSKNVGILSFGDRFYNLTWYLKDAVAHYSSLASFCKSTNDKEGEMWNAGKVDAYEQILLFLDDCCLLDPPEDPANSGR